MHPRLWGRDMWRTIHFVALGYPIREPSAEVVQSYQTFFEVLGPVLPCVKCSKHYHDHVHSHPVRPFLVGRAELFRWTVDLHNAVNASLGREGWTYEQAYEVYSDGRTHKEPGVGSVRKIFTVAVTITVVSLFVVWMVRRRKDFLRRRTPLR